MPLRGYLSSRGVGKYDADISIAYMVHGQWVSKYCVVLGVQGNSLLWWLEGSLPASQLSNFSSHLSSPELQPVTMTFQPSAQGARAEYSGQLPDIPG